MGKTGEIRFEAFSVLVATGNEGNVTEEEGVRSKETAPTDEEKEEPKSDEAENGGPESLEAGMCAPTFDGAKQDPNPTKGG
jgi:hypothetical protein